MGGQILEHRADRRNADAGADQKQLVALRGVAGEGAIGTLDGNTRAGRDAGQLAGVVAEILDGDAQVGRHRHGRERVGMGLPPEARPQEPPLHELASVDPQPLEVVALQHERDGAGAFRVDGNDAEAVVDAAPEGDEQRGTR